MEGEAMIRDRGCVTDSPSMRRPKLAKICFCPSRSYPQKLFKDIKLSVPKACGMASCIFSLSRCMSVSHYSPMQFFIIMKPLSKPSKQLHSKSPGVLTHVPCPHRSGEMRHSSMSRKEVQTIQGDNFKPLEHHQLQKNKRKIYWHNS